MRCEFFIFGHPNILSTHKSTLEFTKDADLSKKGDCILGTKADFSKDELKLMVKTYKQLRMTIKLGRLKQTFDFIANPEFNDDREIVIRSSDFRSGRTLGFLSTKTAKDIARPIITQLKKGKKATIIIEPKIKLFIFDFDDTVHDFKPCLIASNNHLAKIIEKKYKIPKKEAYDGLIEVDSYFSHKGEGKSPALFDRHVWFTEFAKRKKLKLSKKEIQYLVEEYWKAASAKVKPMPHAKTLLRFLQKRYLIAMMTDSDGELKYKYDRIDKSGLGEFFDTIVVSNHINQNKPSKRFYTKILSEFKLKPEECVMVGDKPEVDLILAKELGMPTVHVNHGYWTESSNYKHKAYVDFEIKDLKELITITKENF